MKTIIYRGFRILVGASYIKAVDITKHASYNFDTQQEAENFVDQFRDEENSHPIGCEYCGEVGDRSEHQTHEWDTKLPVTFLEYECKNHICQKRMAYEIDMADAIAKGESWKSNYFLY